MSESMKVDTSQGWVPLVIMVAAVFPMLPLIVLAGYLLMSL